MKKYNLVMTFDSKMKHILMCYRLKDPFEGKYNLIGGKVNSGEKILISAYRELKEESGITCHQIALNPLMTLSYPIEDLELSVYTGRLKQMDVLEDIPHCKVESCEDKEPLLWVPVDSDFTDSMKIAGNGNIDFMMKQAKTYQKMLFHE